MTIMTRTAGLAAILAASVSGAAIAQSVGVGGDAGIGVGVGDSGVSADVGAGADVTAENSASGADTLSTGEAAGERTYGTVISSLRSGGNVEADIAGITADSEVETTTVSELQGQAGDTAAALDNALAQAEGELTEMRGMISANADFQQMIEAEGYSADDVIGVYQASNGSVEVLIDDRS